MKPQKVVHVAYRYQVDIVENKIVSPAILIAAWTCRKNAVEYLQYNGFQKIQGINKWKRMYGKYIVQYAFVEGLPVIKKESSNKTTRFKPKVKP